MFDMGREKALVKNTFIYMVGNFASKFLGFLLLPLYTHFLTTGDLGYFDLVVGAVSIIVPVITLQVNDSMYRYLLDDSSGKDTRKIISCTLFVIFTGILIFTALYFVAAQLGLIKFSYMIFAYIIVTALSVTWQQAARGLKKNMVYALSGVIFTAATLASNLILILVFGMRLDALFYSVIAASVIVILYVEISIGLIRYIGIFPGKRALTGKLVKYSLPLMPNSLNWWIMSTSSRYIITFFINAGANGVFAVSSKFPALITVFNSVFYLAWQESAIQEYNSKDKNEFYTRMFNMYMRFEFAMLILLLPITKAVMSVMVDKSFGEAWMYVPMLYFGTLFLAFSTFYGTGYLSSKDTMGAFTTSIAGSVVNVAINIAFVPLMGIQAASLSSMAASAAMWILRLRQTKKYFIIKIDKPAFYIMLAFTILLTILYYVNSTVVDIASFTGSLAFLYILNRKYVFRILDYGIKMINKTVLARKL